MSPGYAGSWLARVWGRSVDTPSARRCVPRAQDIVEKDMLDGSEDNPRPK